MRRRLGFVLMFMLQQNFIRELELPRKLSG